MRLVKNKEIIYDGFMFVFASLRKDTYLKIVGITLFLQIMKKRVILTKIINNIFCSTRGVGVITRDVQ